MAKMKMSDDDKPGPDWLKLLDIGIDAGSRHTITVVNFLLKQLVTRTAERLDVGASRVRLDFGRVDDDFLWTAKVVATLLHEGQNFVGEPSNDPMQAVANLVDQVECND